MWCVGPEPGNEKEVEEIKEEKPPRNDVTENVPESTRSAIREAVKKEVDALREELRADLHAELAQWLISEGKTGVSQSSNNSKGQMATEETDVVEYKVQESIWDAALFIGMPEVGIGGSLLVSLALAANVAIQGLFLLIIHSGLVKEEFSEQDLNGLKAWRYKIGHDSKFVGGDGGYSLVDRVCGLDLTLEMATEQKNKIELIEEYLNESGTEGFLTGFLCMQGPLMCMLAVAVWAMAIDKEVGSIWDTLGAFRMLPTSNKRRSTVIGTPDGGLELFTVCWIRRFIATVLTVMRLIVAVFLLWVGARYLCYTTSVGDLVLNAVALELVINIDELIFHTMAPNSAKDLIRRLAPLPMKPWGKWYGADLKAICTPFGLALILLVCYYTSLNTNITNLSQAKVILCDGRRDFSMHVDGLQMLHVENLSPFPSEKNYGLEEHSHAVNATKAMMWGLESTSRASAIFPTESEEAKIFGNFRMMDQTSVEKMRVTIDDLYQTRADKSNQDSTGCMDILDGDASKSTLKEELAWRRHLAQQLNMGPHATVDSCQQVQQYCYYNKTLSHLTMALMRALCPVTCGCNSLRRGTIFIAAEFGCPTVCLSNPNATEYETTRCEDVNPHNQSDALVQFAQGIFQEMGEASDNYKVTWQFMEYGCGFLHMIPEASLCVPDENSMEGRFLAGNPFRFQVVKLLTYVCPVQCNCGGKFLSTAPRPPDKFCPRDCVCKWTLWEDVEDNPVNPVSTCSLPILNGTVNVTGNATANVATGAQCCWLLQRHLHFKQALLPYKTNGTDEDTAMAALARDPAALPGLESLFRHITDGASLRSHYLHLGEHLCLKCRISCLHLYARHLGKTYNDTVREVCQTIDDFWHLGKENYTRNEAALELLGR